MEAASDFFAFHVSCFCLHFNVIARNRGRGSRSLIMNEVFVLLGIIFVLCCVNGKCKMQKFIEFRANSRQVLLTGNANKFLFVKHFSIQH